jgi:hypothetical protein
VPLLLPEPLLPPEPLSVRPPLLPPEPLLPLASFKLASGAFADSPLQRPSRSGKAAIGASRKIQLRSLVFMGTP